MRRRRERDKEQHAKKVRPPLVRRLPAGKKGLVPPVLPRKKRRPVRHLLPPAPHKKRRPVRRRPSRLR